MAGRAGGRRLGSCLLIGLLLAAFVAAGLWAVQREGANPPGAPTVLGPLPFVLDTPQGWSSRRQPDPQDDQVLLLLEKTPDDLPFLQVASSELSGSGIAEVVNWGQQRARRRDGFKPGAMRLQGTAQFPGMLSEYTYGNGIHCQDWYVRQEGSGYALTFCAYEQTWTQYLPVFAALMESFEIP